MEKLIEKKAKSYSKKMSKIIDGFLKHWVIYVSIFYIILSLYVIHLKHVAREKPTLSQVERWGEAFWDMIFKPLSIFPLPRGWFSSVVMVTVMFSFFVILRLIILYYQRHYDPDTVQGDAKWLEDLDDYNMRFTEPFGSTDKSGKNNMIFSQDLFMSMNNAKIRRNMNVFVIGGSGAGKSFNLVGPNLLQANCSYAVTDPSGGLYKEYGPFLEHYGYRIKCFNLSSMEKSSHYNPFNYIHSDKDIEILVTTLISNTNPPDKSGGDPFWEKSETALLNALIAYLHHFSAPETQNFSNVMRLMLAAEIDENDSNAKSPLDMIFDEIEDKAPESFALKQYKLFKMGAGKTLKGILISCGVRLQAFSLDLVATLTDTDDIELDRVGDEKTALFIILPTGDKTFNFLASLMYSQLFQRVYDYCENTAEYSQLIVDGEGQLVRTYRARSPEESMEKAKEAEAFLERARNGYIQANHQFGWFELRTQDEELVLYRGTQELVVRALQLLKAGRVMPNSEQSNHGQRLPVHLRLILDEFANIGKIPEFEQKVATIRKYEISVTIILQSLSQMKNLYKDNWSEISGNCDTTIYLGGGADTETTKWISELLGKETRTVLNTSFGKSGSMSINRQGVELFSAPQLRTMNEDDCIVLLKSMYAYKGKKYKTIDHPEYGLLSTFRPYMFDLKKISYLEKNDFIEKQILLEEAEEVHGEIAESTDSEAIERQEAEQAKEDRKEELEKNKDANEEEILQKAEALENKPEEAQEKYSNPNIGVANEEDEVSVSRGVGEETFNSLLVDNENAMIEEFIFSNTGAALDSDDFSSSQQSA